MIKKEGRVTWCPMVDEDPKDESFHAPSKFLLHDPARLSSARLQRTTLIS
jgi:hypothetical protein